MILGNISEIAAGTVWFLFLDQVMGWYPPGESALVFPGEGRLVNFDWSQSSLAGAW